MTRREAEARVICRAPIVVDRLYHCELKSGHEGKHLHVVTPGLTIEWAYAPKTKEQKLKVAALSRSRRKGRK